MKPFSSITFEIDGRLYQTTGTPGTTLAALIPLTVSYSTESSWDHPDPAQCSGSLWVPNAQAIYAPQVGHPIRIRGWINGTVHTLFSGILETITAYRNYDHDLPDGAIVEFTARDALARVARERVNLPPLHRTSGISTTDLVNHLNRYTRTARFIDYQKGNRMKIPIGPFDGIEDASPLEVFQDIAMTYGATVVSATDNYNALRSKTKPLIELSPQFTTLDQDKIRIPSSAIMSIPITITHDDSVTQFSTRVFTQSDQEDQYLEEKTIIHQARQAVVEQHGIIERSLNTYSLNTLLPVLEQRITKALARNAGEPRLAESVELRIDQLQALNPRNLGALFAPAESLGRYVEITGPIDHPIDADNYPIISRFQRVIGVTYTIDEDTTLTIDLEPPSISGR